MPNLPLKPDKIPLVEEEEEEAKTPDLLPKPEKIPLVEEEEEEAEATTEAETPHLNNPLHID